MPNPLASVGVAMRRRDVMRMLGAAAALWPLPTRAQPAKVPRVGILTPAESDQTSVFAAFRKGLRDAGYVEGQTIVLDFGLAKGHLDALPALATELVRLPVDVVVTDGGEATQAAAGVTRTIPIVMAIAPDAIASGLVASTARPAGNVTGMTLGRIEQGGKRLELLKQAVPGMARVTVLLNPKNMPAQLQLRTTEEAAKTLGVQIATLSASTPDELRALVPADLSGIDGLVVPADPVFWNHRGTIIALAAAARVPAVYPERDYAVEGGLIAFGPNVPDSFRRAASYVDRILRGARPGDLPIDEASKFEFVINLRAARQLGLSLPPLFLARADEVIE
jgi:putative ABC transport system substrate-binding protein